MPPESFNEAIDSTPESTFESGSKSRFLHLFIHFFNPPVEGPTFRDFIGDFFTKDRK